MNIFKDTMSEMTYGQVEKLVEQEAVVLLPIGICALFARCFFSGNADPKKDMLLFTNCTWKCHV